MNASFFLSLLASTVLAAAELPPLPQPATSFGATTQDGWLYVYGGNSGKAHEFHRESINGDHFRVQLPDGKQWETLKADLPLLGAPMVSFQGKIYRTGGMQAFNAKGETNDIRSSDAVAAFDPAKGVWETLPSLPEPRSSHDATILDGTLYLGGGWKLGGRKKDNEGEWHTTILSLNLAEPSGGWRTQRQPFERRALAVVAHASRLWFIGGMDSKDDPSRQVNWLDPKTGEWGKGPDLPPSPMAGFGVAACSVDGRLVVSPLSGSVYILGTDGAHWEEVTKLAKPRFFHRLLPVPDGGLVAIGGSSRKSQILEPEWVSLKPVDHGAEPATQATDAPAFADEKKNAASASDWNQWRGCNRDGVVEESAWMKEWPEGGPAQSWRANVGVGMSSCVVVNGLLITQGNDGKGQDAIVALDATTGAERWRHTFVCPTAAHEMPIVPAGPGSTPTVVGTNVYAISREGDLFCLDRQSGEVVWTKHLIRDLGGKRPVYGYSQSSLVDRGRLFLDIGSAPGQPGSTVALDAATGEIVWRNGVGEAGYSSARIVERNGRRFVAMFKGEALDVFDPADGRVLWSHRTTVRDFCNAATPAVVGHRLLASNTGTDLATLLDWDSGSHPNPQPVWTHKQFALLFNSAIFHSGALFGFNEKRRGHHEFTCIDAQTGESKWVSDAVPTGTFILADGHWLFLTREGEVVLAPASASELKPIARFKAFDGKCYATPTLAGGRLFVRSNAGEVAAYALR